MTPKAMLPELLARLTRSVLDGSAEAVVTKVFGLVAAGITGTVGIAVGWERLMRSRRTADVERGASTMTVSDRDDTPTLQVVVVSTTDHAEVRMLEGERDDARRLLALEQADHSVTRRELMRARAVIEQHRLEMERKRDDINRGLRLPDRSAGYAVHVTEEDASDLATTPPKGHSWPTR